ncbi:MAG: flagellar basal body P-ring formation protein FlgA [Piscinibacter sp.]|nr:flagellar basal body P-ring formation protein FlgA [Piscinibacter sp.]
MEEQARQFAQDAAAGAGVRVEVVVGSLDPRLRLAPCERVEPYVPSGSRLWGRSRIGLRCVEGPTRWNVYLPLTVKVFGPGLVAARALPAGTVLAAADMQPAEVDLAAGGLLLQAPDLAVGRTLAHPLVAGQTVRPTDLRARQWFAAGEMVQIVAVGRGFQISGEGQALGPGLEGQPARVRLEGGRIVSGQPVAERRVEIRL